MIVKALCAICGGKCLQGLNHNVSLSLTIFFMLKWLSISGEEEEGRRWESSFETDVSYLMGWVS